MRRDAVDAERAVPIPVDQQRGVARLLLDREQQEAREAVDREPCPSQRRLVNERERCRADDDSSRPLTRTTLRFTRVEKGFSLLLECSVGWVEAIRSKK